MTCVRAPLFVALGAALALCSPMPAVAGEAAAWPSGLYGSVRMSKETGDLGGMELRFFSQDGRPMVEAVLCEGWCNASHIAPLERTAQGFAFRYVERSTSEQGATEEVLRVTLVPARGGFRAALASNGEPATPLWEAAAQLRRLKQPFGLAVVHNQKD